MAKKRKTRRSSLGFSVAQVTKAGAGIHGGTDRRRKAKRERQKAKKQLRDGW